MIQSHPLMFLFSTLKELYELTTNLLQSDHNGSMSGLFQSFTRIGKSGLDTIKNLFAMRFNLLIVEIKITRLNERTVKSF